MMNLQQWAVLVLVCVAGAAMACGQATTQPAGETEQAAQPTTAPATVMAQIGEKTLTWGEVEALKAQRMPTLESAGIIDVWKVTQVLAQAFQKGDLLKDLERQKLYEYDMSQLQANWYLRSMIANVQVTDEEIAEFYEQRLAQSDEFREPQTVTAKFIAAKEKEEADKIRQRLIEGEDFDKLMEEYAEQTKQVTGLSDVMVEDIRADRLRNNVGTQWQALQQVQLDQPIGPRRIPGGYLMYKVTARNEGPAKPLEEVRETIRQRLLNSKQLERHTEILNEAKEQAGVEELPQMGRRR